MTNSSKPLAWSQTAAGKGDWYDGYDSNNEGSFVDLTVLKGAELQEARNIILENNIALLGQKGVTRAQIEDPETDVGKFFEKLKKDIRIAEIQAESGNEVRDSMQEAAYYETTAQDRGDVWGDDADTTQGRSYFDHVSNLTDEQLATSQFTPEQMVDAMYTKGFGDSLDQIDPEGRAYWLDRLTDKDNPISVQDMAKSFRVSEEGNIRDIWHEEYGRDIDTEGLDYWQQHTGDFSEGGYTQGSNPGGHNDFDITNELNRIITDHDPATAQAETLIRDGTWEHLGQASSQAQHNIKPDGTPFTAASNEEVVNWVKKIQAGDLNLQDVVGRYTIEDGKQVEGTAGILQDRSDRIDAFNTFDKDDAGDNPTGMGRFPSLEEIQATIDKGQTPDDIRKELGEEVWGLLTDELVKTFDPEDEDPILDLQLENHPGDVEQDPTPEDPLDAFTDPDVTTTGRLGTRPGPGETWGQDGTTQSGLGEDGWRPTSTGFNQPTPIPRTRTDVNYMPEYKPGAWSDFDVTSTDVPFIKAKNEFETVRGNKPAPPQPLATPTVVNRLTGKSAKGVRTKRSDAYKDINRSRGTGQLGRTQQNQSLNLS